MNTTWEPTHRRSTMGPKLEKKFPDAFAYYEDRRTGQIRGIAFEEWGDIESHEKAFRLWKTEHVSVRQSFYAVDYERGWTGRGGELA